VSLLVAVMTAPINLIVDVIFHRILEAPSGDAVKIKTQDSAAFRAGNRVSKAVRRASVNVAAAVNDVVLKLKPHKQMTALMLIPERTLLAQSLASVATESIMSVFNEVQMKSLMNMKTRHDANIKIMENKANRVQSIRIPVILTAFDEIAPLFKDLTNDLNMQRRKLKAIDQEIFDIQWG
jgi:hypothetical protein